jgi:hypothetical protein
MFFAIDADHLSRDKVGVRRGQEEIRADEIFGDLIPRMARAFFLGFQKLRREFFLTGSVTVRLGATTLTVIPYLPNSRAMQRENL